MATDNTHTTQSDGARKAQTLGRIEETAVDVTLGCLANLSPEMPDEQFDRRSRTAESLMRIAGHARTLRERNEKDARDHAGRDGASDSDADIQKLSDKLDQNIRRLEQKEENLAAEVPHGGRP